jgi:hypothetical protein
MFKRAVLGTAAPDDDLVEDSSAVLQRITELKASCDEEPKSCTLSRGTARLYTQFQKNSAAYNAESIALRMRRTAISVSTSRRWPSAPACCRRTLRMSVTCRFHCRHAVQMSRCRRNPRRSTGDNCRSIPSETRRAASRQLRLSSLKFLMVFETSFSPGTRAVPAARDRESRRHESL